jgi:drug/metabolite transporter (DMT)-like permease
VALLSAALYGTADFLGGLAARRGGAALAATVLSQGVGLVIVAALLPLVPSDPLTRTVVGWAAAAGLTGGAGVALLYYGLAVGRVSVVAPVTAVCGITIPVLVGLALGERPGAVALAGVAVAVASVALISRHDDPARKPGAPVDRSLPIALASGVAIGGFLVCLSRTGTGSGLWPLLIARVASTLSLALAARAIGVPLAVPRLAWAPAVASGGLDMVANALYLIAVREGPLGLIATLTSLYPASTVLLARIVLRERLQPLQSVGLACAVAAIVLITAR